MALTPGTRLGPYEIISAVGAGGMGEVYRAKDTRLNRDVAVKVLPAAFAQDPDRRARFEREAQTVAALSHPNIVNIFDTGVHPSTGSGHPSTGSGQAHPYVVMELLDGETLRERTAQGPLPVRKTIEFAVQIARGLAAAHDKGLIHRDLKPENIFLLKDGQVKILDFGLARQAMGSASGATETVAAMTDPGMVMGTVGYMAPEQVRAQNVDARTDLFAFGAVLYEMLSGARAFQRDTAAETMTAILKDDPPEIAGTRAEISPSLDRIVRHCLEKNPLERFQTARDVAFALGALSGSNTSTSGAFVAPSGRLWRRWLATAAVILVALAVGAALMRRFAPSPNMPTFHRITFQRGTIDNARFEPGTTNVVYSARWQGGRPTVFSVHPQSPESRPIGAADTLFLAVSAQQEVAVLLSPRLTSGLFGGTLATMPLAGGGTRELAKRVIAADFTADGKQLAFVEFTGDTSRVQLPAGTTIYSTSALTTAMRCAPHGDLIALSTTGGIIVIDASGKERARVKAFATGMAWSPDGSELWFSQRDGPGSSVLRAVKPGGAPRDIWRGSGFQSLQDIAADGTLLMKSVEFQGGVLVQRSDSAAGSDFGWLDGSMAADVSPSGDALLIDEQGDAGGGFYIRKLDGSPAVRLGRGRALAWSPKGDAVLAAKDEFTFVVVPVGAGTLRELPHPGMIAQFGWFAPDGGRVLINGRVGDKPYRFSWIDESGAVRPAGPDSLDHWAGQKVLSNDGRRVAAWPSGETGKNKLAVYALDGAGMQNVVGMDVNEAVIQFTADDKHLLVYDRDRLPARIYALDFTTGQRTLWREFTPSDPAGISGFPSIAMTADGQVVAFNYRRALGTAYLITGLR